MSIPRYISAEDADRVLTWPGLVAALKQAHLTPAPTIADQHLKMDQGGMLNRVAWIPGLGVGLKTVSVFPGNPSRPDPLPTVQGVFVLFDDQDGQVRALIDGATLTRWKTVADSLLGASLLARPESETLLLVGAGTIATTLAQAYPTLFPSIKRLLVWNRTHANAEKLARQLGGTAIESLEEGVRQADIISSATVSVEPIIQGAWLQPGTHLDLIGAYRPDMREADDQATQVSRVFVDSRKTTLGEIGELIKPIESGAITEADVLADLYDLVRGAPGRLNDQDITLYKNGGGAHLDLMTAQYLLEQVSNQGGR
ncbi:Ornithine cyclodeaminase [Nitrincola lacisaponensis]|uniref:Ornithine cyclodeaminase n=1 Tax=Nitrincola lacisaponensis TaxID=267850 RepID=A0A063Y042_9GAMM|nr:ornithine cyclodeaminase [Nitrincola lacisaponensis]KDE39713.1 Ornithine cyclodeaminase [Nitrincola lacisaponensis]